MTRYIPTFFVVFLLGACTFAPIPELGFEGYTTPDPIKMGCDYLTETIPENDLGPNVCSVDHDINETGR